MSVPTAGAPDERCVEILVATISLFQVQDVYSGEIIRGLKTGDNFSVTVNPSGVVMWYLSPVAQPWRIVRQQAPREGFRPVLL